MSGESARGVEAGRRTVTVDEGDAGALAEELAKIPAALREDPNPGVLQASLHAFYDFSLLLLGVLATPYVLIRNARQPGFGAMILARLGRGLVELPRGTRPRLLVHGVSVGEVKAAHALVRAIEAAHPELEVVVSTSTDTGIEVAHKLFPDNHVVRFPADVSFVVRRFLRRVDPAFVLLVELEVWPNFLRQCNRSGRAVAVVNGRITEMSHGYYVLFRKLLPQFNRISLFCVQLEQYSRRFQQLGVRPERILITGNVKVDGLAIGEVDPGAQLRELLGPGPDQAVIVAGSTHEPEEALVARVWSRVASGARLVLVPRHPRRCEAVAAELEAQGVRVQRLSELRAGEAPERSKVALVDTIGELEAVYALADLVFVGGSLVPHGGQNVLEPAAQGKAVVFGPHVSNFMQEAALLLGAEACVQVPDEDGLARAFRELLADPGRRAAMGHAAMEAVASQRGATRRTLDALDAVELERLIAQPSGR